MPLSHTEYQSPEGLGGHLLHWFPNLIFFVCLLRNFSFGPLHAVKTREDELQDLEPPPRPGTPLESNIKHTNPTFLIIHLRTLSACSMPDTYPMRLTFWCRFMHVT